MKPAVRYKLSAISYKLNLVAREFMPRLGLALGPARHILPDAPVDILHIRELPRFNALHIVRLLLGLNLGSTHLNLTIKQYNNLALC